jgi:hypothetical protein
MAVIFRITLNGYYRQSILKRDFYLSGNRREDKFGSKYYKEKNMFSKFNRLLLGLFIIGSLSVFPTDFVRASRDVCEYVEVDKSKPLHTVYFRPSDIERAIDRQQEINHLSLSKAKGSVGELLARSEIEKGALLLKGKKLVSITTMFRQQGCNVEKYLRDGADRGIDDIFVVLREDGWINKNYHPVFHEAKYNGKCNMRLATTKTLCDQLSFQWLDRNLRKVASRSSAVSTDFCLGDKNGIIIKSCSKCRTSFRENVKWLGDMLASGNFHRTASLLCAKGALNIYNVNGS